MLPTVAEVLALDQVRRGEPRVLAGSERLSAPVRWVHVMELASAAHLLRGGELVLSTGIGLPASSAGLARYVADLAAAGVSGLAVELGSRYTRSLPPALVNAAADHRLPLIELARETPFVEITEAVHAQIIDAQLAELRSAERLHQVFTDLAVSGASADDVVAQTAQLAGCPVILENLAHQVLACAPLRDEAARLLAGFAGRARAATAGGRTGYDPATGWLLTVVGARGQDWGRLILVRGTPPGPGDVALIERAATTLALGRLVDHQEQSLERQAHRTMLSAFLGSGYSDPAEAEARARALGVPVTGRLLVAIVVRAGTGGSRSGSRPPSRSRPAGGLARLARSAVIADSLASVCRQLRVPALAAALDDDRAAAVLALPQRSDPDALLGRLATGLRPRIAEDDVIGAGSAVTSVDAIGRSLREADQVAAAAAGSHFQAFYRLTDLRLHGLLYLLRDDPRLQAFAERELGPLLVHDETAAQPLLPALTAYLEAGGNKAAAAHRARLARPTMYERLRQVEDVLGISLERAESRLSLHVALLAHRSASG